MAKTLIFPAPRMPFQKLAARIQPAEGLLQEDWANHPNGGGWVQKTAFAAKTAYVGPCAIVSGNARVLDLARIDDEALITDTAMIAGNAVVGGKARVGGKAKVFGTARILGDAQVGGEFFLDRGELREGISLVFKDRPQKPHQRKEAVQMQLDV